MTSPTRPWSRRPASPRVATTSRSATLGDGICCEYGDGSYTLEVDGVVVATGDSEMGRPSHRTGGDIPGCTDPDACNFSASATVMVLHHPRILRTPRADNDGIVTRTKWQRKFVQFDDVVGQHRSGMTTYRVWAEFADPTEQLVAAARQAPPSAPPTRRREPCGLWSRSTPAAAAHRGRAGQLRRRQHHRTDS